MKYTLLFWGLLFVLFSACHSNQNKVNQAALAEEKKQRELKYLTETDIHEKANEVGPQLVAACEQALLTQLTQAIEQQGLAGALQYCNIHAQGILDSVENPFKATIKRVTTKNRNPENLPDTLTLAYFDAYQYAIEQGAVAEPQAVKANKDYYLYTKPIVLGNPLCLQCHGIPGETLDAEAEALIKQLYPNDKATGYNLNELRGIWAVYMAKKDLVMGM